MRNCTAENDCVNIGRQMGKRRESARARPSRDYKISKQGQDAEAAINLCAQSTEKTNETGSRVALLAIAQCARNRHQCAAVKWCE